MALNIKAVVSKYEYNFDDDNGTIRITGYYTFGGGPSFDVTVAWADYSLITTLIVGITEAIIDYAQSNYGVTVTASQILMPSLQHGSIGL